MELPSSSTPPLLFSGRSWRFGYRRRRSHRVAPFGGCPVLWPELDRQLAKLAEALLILPPEAGLKEIEIAYSRRDRAASASVIADGDIDIFAMADFGKRRPV